MFLLTWLLLSLPLMYLLRASSVAVMYVVGVTFWAASVHFQLEKQLVWVLLALVLPYYWQQMQQDRDSNATAILSWVWNLCLYGCFTVAIGNSMKTFTPLIYSALFSINYMVGVLWFNTNRETWRMPFKTIGLVGSVISVFIMTFREYWRHLRIDFTTVSTTETVLVISLLLLVVAGIVHLLRQSNRKNLPFSVAPLLISSAFLLQSVDASGIAATVLLNSYLLLLSIWTIGTGTRNRNIGLVNVGMLLLASLMFARFLDANLSFVIRGVVFVCLGIGFLLVNWLMVRRKSGGQHEK